MLSVAASGQIVRVKNQPTVMGHYHLNVTNVAEQNKFWTVLGGKVARKGPLNIVRFPGGLILMDQSRPTGGTRGTSLNHIGFEVPDCTAMVNKMRDAGYPIVTRTEVSGGQARSDVFRHPTMNIDLAFVIGPDDIKVEIVGNPAVKVATVHHAHLFVPDVEKTRGWYVTTFGAKAGRRGPFEEAVLPGIRLSFQKADGVVGTRGRSIDHIGFETGDLKKLRSDVSGRGGRIESQGRTIAGLKSQGLLLTDPDGTLIELTEGLEKMGK